MKDKVLKLCRRLKKCTLNDLILYTEETEDIVKMALSYLENKGCIKINRDLIVFIQNPQKSNIEQKKLNIMLNYATEEDIDSIIKGFCLEILPNKLQHFVSVKRQCIAEYYGKFRELIYDNQYNVLKQNFNKKPQQGRCRVVALSDYNVQKKNRTVSSSAGTLSEELALVSKKSGEYKPVTVYTDPLTGKRVAPDVGWSHNPASGLIEQE